MTQTRRSEATLPALELTAADVEAHVLPRNLLTATNKIPDIGRPDFGPVTVLRAAPPAPQAYRPNVEGCTSTWTRRGARGVGLLGSAAVTVGAQDSAIGLRAVTLVLTICGG